APWAKVSDAREASAQGAALGFPVAVKVMGEQFVHKSDVGGVLLDLKSEAEVGEAYKRLATLIEKTDPGVKERSVLVQRMIAEGHELLVGGKQDSTFGPIVLVGLGGVYVEVFGDVALRVAPVSAVEARKMFAEIRGGKLLEGVRGQPPADLETLVTMSQRISQLVCDLPQIKELDLNPIKVLPQGQGCFAVDCRMILA
ncbi:MAG: acetate--CoA ligase family protein, partial [Deltaproteobacteria bacterium]|nr:acetate--CoA ligase family protein [Deltaproteobacteria bacterium]